MIEVKDICVNYGKNEIIKNLTFNVKSGNILCVLGENGSGKSTLFKSLLKFINVKSGEIIIDEINIKNLSSTDIAKSTSYIPQNHIPSFDFSVVDVVLMGLYANKEGFYKKFKKEDYTRVVDTLKTLNIEYLADKNYRKISGGERQLVLIARALIQNTKYIIMDEPTSNLDFGNQIKIMEISKNLKKKNIGIVITTHNPTHALMYADDVLVFRKNKNFIFGKTEDVLTENLLTEIYNIPIEIIRTDKYKICSPNYDNL